MQEPKKPEPQPAQDENQIIAERRAKLAKLRAEGPAFPNDFAGTDASAELAARYGGLSAEELEKSAPEATIAGRLMLKRVMGKASFGVLQDGSDRIQIYVSDDHSGK
ncbi:MAG TPA: lysine--tRNA ligase, partial [Burkholderiales bacterium]|nr:lysine--tRNA ligase [Burkholderiales bacterium]